MLQQRAFDKYHSGGLWTNTCCSHPRPAEPLENAVHRRLQEEMGFDCELTYLDSFIYTAEFDNGLSEQEFDHVWVGKYDHRITPNSQEVESYKWMGIAALREDILDHPQKYTPWLKIVLNKFDFSSQTEKDFPMK